MAKAPDLLADLKDEEAVKPDQSTLDLLSQITEDDGTAWMPWADEDQPKGIQGTVTALGTVTSEFNDMGDKPIVSLVDDEGNAWSVRGYGFVLEGQIQNCLDRGMQVGDVFAIKYLGEQRNRKNTFTYHNAKATFLKQRN